MKYDIKEQKKKKDVIWCKNKQQKKYVKIRRRKHVEVKPNLYNNYDFNDNITIV